MKKRGRKKKVVTSTPQSENSSATDQDGPVLDLEKSKKTLTLQNSASLELII